MNTEIINQMVWRKLEDGTIELVSNKDIEIQTPSTDYLIKDKEYKLLEMYKELEELKNI